MAKRNGNGHAHDTGPDDPRHNQIRLFFHCALCLAEIKKLNLQIAPREYGQLEVGWTVKGIQIWCKRHEANVMHMDFQGMKHPACTSRL